MRKLLIALAALAAIGSAAPVYAQESGTTTQPTFTSSPFAPHALAQAVTTIQTQEGLAREAKLIALDERIGKAQRGISRGKKMVLWGSAIFAGGMAVAVLSATDSCLNSDDFHAQLAPKGCSTGEYAGVYTAAAGGVVAIFGTTNWITNASRLHRAEAERRELTGISVEVTPTTVAANYRVSW